jgi:hypothetical protein
VRDFSVGANRQESRRLVYDKDVPVLVEYHEAVRQETWTGAFAHGFHCTFSNGDQGLDAMFAQYGG